MKNLKFLQSPKTHFVVIVVLFILLPVLAVFQYFWLGQLSEAEKIRMKTNLQTSAERFSEEFDKELTDIYKTFSDINLNLKSDNAKILHKTLTGWKRNTDLPDLISSIYVVNLLPTKDIYFQEFDTSHVELKKEEWPQNLLFLNKYFKQDIDNVFIRVISLTHGPILKPVPMILISQPTEIFIDTNKENCTDNWLILILLNEKTIFEKFIPYLEKKYFTQNAELMYNIMIEKEGKINEEFYKSDTSLTFTDFSVPDARTRIGTWRTRNMIIASAQYVTETGELKIKKKIKEETTLSIQVFTSDSTQSTESSKYLIAKVDRWNLLAKHISGSLESIVSRARFTNLLISYVILFILGAGIVLALVYAKRVQTIGQQQMEFVAGVTHELRTPLAVIHSAGENIADGVLKDEDQYKKYGILIRDEGKRLSKMVEQILGYAGIQSKKQANQFEPVDLIDLINKTIENYNNNTSIEISTGCSYAVVMGDKNALSTAIINILDNSIKYCETKSQIVIQINQSQNNKSCIIEISDNGIGIDAEDISNIFKPFYRGKNSAEKTIPGSGLGLSLVKGIIENHGGEISVDSETGKGTVVKIELPQLKTA